MPWGELEWEWKKKKKNQKREQNKFQRYLQGNIQQKLITTETGKLVSKSSGLYSLCLPSTAHWT